MAVATVAAMAVAMAVATTAAVHDWATVCEACFHDCVLADVDTDCSVAADATRVAIPVAEQVVAMQALLVLDADATSSVRLSITRK